MAKKNKLIRALLKKGHSPAGARYLAKKKKGTKPTYFKGKAFERPTIESQLKAAGLTEKDLRALRGKKKK